MKVKVNDRCIGCGSCVSITDGKIFDFNDEGLATEVVNEVPEDLKEVAIDAVNSCPVGAIEEED